MVNTEELWEIGNLMWTFQTYGLSSDRGKCAEQVGVQVADDEALKSLRSGLAFADIGFLEKGREGILKALELDPAVFERAPGPDECWLLCAKAGTGASGGGFPACDLDQSAHGPPSEPGLASGGPSKKTGHRLAAALPQDEPVKQAVIARQAHVDGRCEV